MNIFNNLEQYTRKNEQRQKTKLEEPKTNFQNIKEILLDGLPAIGLYFGLLTISGLIWYFGSISFFWLCILGAYFSICIRNYHPRVCSLVRFF